MDKRVLVFSVVLLTAVAVGSLGAQPEDDATEDVQKDQPEDSAVEIVQSSAADDDAEQKRWTVAVVADLNGPFGSTEYNRHVHAAAEWIRDDLQPDLVISAGDMVAGQQEGLDYRAMWTAFHEAFTDELAAGDIPFAASPGNHDASGQPRFWRERIEYARQWKLRRPRLQYVDDAFYPFYYAFEMGPALFVSLDGTEVGPLDDAQIEWLEEVLDRNEHLEVTVLFSHVPQYPVAEGRAHETFGDDRLAELMADYDVDLKVSGHHHAYYPARKDGTIFLHAHALGSGPRAFLGEEAPRARNVAVFEYTEEGVERVEAYVSPEFEETVDRGGLPEAIETDDAELRRLDDQ